MVASLRTRSGRPWPERHWEQIFHSVGSACDHLMYSLGAQHFETRLIRFDPCCRDTAGKVLSSASRKSIGITSRSLILVVACLSGGLSSRHDSIPPRLCPAKRKSQLSRTELDSGNRDDVLTMRDLLMKALHHVPRFWVRAISAPQCGPFQSQRRIVYDRLCEITDTVRELST
jgi:hypothetical protein